MNSTASSVDQSKRRKWVKIVCAIVLWTMVNIVMSQVGVATWLRSQVNGAFAGGIMVFLTLPILLKQHNRHYTGQRKRWVRWALAAFFVATITGYVLLVSQHRPPQDFFIFGGAFYLLSALFVFSKVTPFIALPVRRLSVDPPYDERELPAMLRAYANAYTFWHALVGMLLLYLGLATEGHWWLPRDFTEWMTLYFLFVFLGVMFPTLVAEWTIPLPPETKDEA